MKKITLSIISILLVLLLCAPQFYATSVDRTERISMNWTTSMNSPPYPASNPIPANNAVDIELNVTISWIGGDPDGDPVSYNVFFGTSPNPPNVEVVYRSNTYNPGPLQYDTRYYWKIDTYADNGGATTGPVWSFTTKDDTPPYTPNTPFPMNNALDIERNITLSWIGGDPDGDQVTYDIYFGTNTNPPIIIMDQNDTEYNPTILEYNTNYYWKIDATDDYGYTTAGPVWSFTTKDDTPPNIPSDPIPDDNSMDIPIDITLIWSGGDPDNDTVTYDLYFGTDPTPDLEVEDLNVTSYDPGRLDFVTTYYWKIEATDDYGYTSTGPVWSFTTRENAAPYIPNNPIPENGSTNVYIDAVLSWQGGDPDNDTITYDVYFGIAENPPKVISNISTTSYEPSNMNTTTKYYWKIVAWDDHGHTVSSPLWNFKTSIYTNSPPEKPSRPTGPTSGRPGISYTYSSSTTDSNGEPIFYKFDWDDGTESGWLGPYNSGQGITTSHIWDSTGNYAVKVKAKDIYGGESFWSDPLTISMPKNKAFDLFHYILERYPFLEIYLKFSIPQCFSL